MGLRRRGGQEGHDKSGKKAHGNSFGARRPSAGDREDGRSPGSELLPALAFPACGPVASRERGRSPYSRGGGTGLSPASRFTSWRGTVDRRLTATRGKGNRKIGRATGRERGGA